MHTLTYVDRHSFPCQIARQPDSQTHSDAFRHTMRSHSCALRFYWGGGHGAGRGCWGHQPDNTMIWKALFVSDHNSDHYYTVEGMIHLSNVLECGPRVKPQSRLLHVTHTCKCGSISNLVCLTDPSMRPHECSKGCEPASNTHPRSCSSLDL